MFMAESNSRQRLRPWLIGQLDKGSIPGLNWLENESSKISKEKKFKIPWKHGGKHDWTPDQSRVFKEWAVHTGKFREGVDDENFAKWKTNLRCALNKAADIQEIPEESQKDTENPYKVYKFLPKKSKDVHPIHKRNYAAGEEFLMQSEDGNVPRHVASYSSSDSSLASRGSVPSIPGRGAPMVQGKPVCDIPSDLDGLSSSSLRDATEGISSFDTKNYLTEEEMDCSDGDSQSSDGRVPAVLKGPPFQGQPVFLEPQIKQEVSDASVPPLCHAGVLYPGVIFNDHLVNIAESGMADCNAGLVGASALCAAVTDPQHLTNYSESNIHCHPVYLTTAASPAYSDASSPPAPCAVVHPFTPPSPKPDTGVLTALPTTSPPPPLGVTPPASSPPHLFPVATQAPSPALPFSPPVCSPQREQLPPDGLPAVAVTQEMAGLDMREAGNAVPPVLHQYPLQATRCHADVDIGHPCPRTLDECALMVTVFYKGRQIMSHHVTDPAGCIIAYRPFTEQQGQILDDVGLNVIKAKVYDQKPGRKVIELPAWEKTGNDILDREVDNLLQNTGRGVIIESKKGDIYAKRLCKTSVYFATHFDNEKWMKINRHEDAQEQVKIFDFHNTFEPAIDQFALEARANVNTEVNHPKPDVYLFIGQNGTPSNAHTRYVYVRITSCEACRVLSTVEKSLYSISAEVSDSNSLDQIDRTLRREFDKHAT